MSRQAVLLCLFLSGCFTATNERPPFEELAPQEQSAVQIVLGELESLDAALRRTRDCSISALLDPESIDNSFRDAIVALNFGDLIHLSIWENLSEAQRAMMQSWFGANSASDAEAVYKKLFYQFLTVQLGAQQFIYKAVDTSRHSRALFNIERDSLCLAISHFDADGRGPEMRAFIKQSCARFVEVQAAVWEPRYTLGDDYMHEPANLNEIFTPEAPVGWLYFICRLSELASGSGPDAAKGLSAEMDRMLDLHQRSCQGGSYLDRSP